MDVEPQPFTADAANEENPTARPVWGTPGPTAPWSARKTLAAAGIAVTLAAGGALVIQAAGGGASEQGPGPGQDGPPGFGGPGFGGPPGFGPGATDEANLPTALHGEFVVSDGRGGYTTQLTQTGTVIAVSDTSITSRSDDGFTQTYLITTETRQGRGPIAPGDTATIRAVTENGTVTATAISPQR